MSMINHFLPASSTVATRVATDGLDQQVVGTSRHISVLQHIRVRSTPIDSTLLAEAIQ